MIRKDQNNTGSQVGQYGLNPNAYRTTPARRSAEAVDPLTVAAGVGLLTTFLDQGGSQSGNQTTTQQNLPNWAIPYAQNTMNIGSQFTLNPNYRPSTLDRDYSGIRGYNQTPNLENLDGQLPPDMRGGGPLLRAPIQMSNDSQRFKQPQNRAEMFEMAMTNPDYAKNMDLDQMFGKEADQIRQNLGLSSRGGGRQNSKVLEEEANLLESPAPQTDPYAGMDVRLGYGRDYDPSKVYSNEELVALATSPSGEHNPDTYQKLVAAQNSLKNNQAQQAQTQTNQTEGEAEAEAEAVPFGETLTPFQAFDRQRFAGPSAGTVRGEGILSGRYDQRFGEGGTDPFAAATTAVDKAAGYTSGFEGTTGEGGLGKQAGNYRGSLATAQDPGIFQSKSYDTPGLQNTFSNPNAGLTNVNAGMRNVNAGLQSSQYGNANRGLQGPVNYERDQSFEQSMQRFMDPYTDRVVNQTMRDMDRVRQMQNSGISGSAARSGAFGGSRSQLALAENNRNVADRTAAAVGQLRSQGFQNAAQLAQQEAMQRLGLTASDVQNVRGLQSQGNLQGQRLTADDLQNVRGLTSQGALAAQGLRSQGALAAQGLESQGALAALNANAGLYGQALGLNAGMDRAALQANAGLLSDAMSLDAADLRDRRAIASDEAKFSELASRAAGALNLQGGTALGDLAKMGTADERQRIADMVASGQAGDVRNQQDLDFIYNEFQRELGYPMDMINLRNTAISPATNSVVTTSSPLYGQNPLLQGLGAGLSTWSLLNDE
jgi:hypothetical protein